MSKVPMKRLDEILPPPAIRQVQDFLASVQAGEVVIGDYFDLHKPLRNRLQPYADDAKLKGVVDLDYLVLALLTRLGKEFPDLIPGGVPVDIKEVP